MSGMTTYVCPKCEFRYSILTAIPHNTERKCWACNERMTREGSQ